MSKNCKGEHTYLYIESGGEAKERQRVGQMSFSPSPTMPVYK